jgi:hypothetical protein
MAASTTAMGDIGGLDDGLYRDNKPAWALLAE